MKINNLNIDVSDMSPDRTIRSFKVNGDIGAEFEIIVLQADTLKYYNFNDSGFFIKTTTEDADNYNKFYGQSSYSKIQSVINQQPSIVKTFNTINYEGSKASTINPKNEYDLNGSLIYTAEEQVDINNAETWLSGGDTLGWECAEIKTDLDTGSIIEFIKKEGQWFNYIKGSSTNQGLDTSRFSVQGVGIVSSVQSI